MIGVNVRTPATFTASKPPPGYIPGVGRGAVGFMTRSDVGSAGGGAMGAAAGVVTGAGRGVAAATGIAAARAAASGTVAGASSTQKRETDLTESNFDAFAGYGERLFSDAPYDADDAEADKVYRQVDTAMEERHKTRRELKEAEEARKMRLNQSRIGDSFADVKRQLAEVKPEEWDAIPDIGDRSLRYKKKFSDSFYTPITDSLLMAGAGSGGATAIDPRSSGGAGSAIPGGASSVPGAASSSSSSSAAAGGATDIYGLREARGQMLTMRLDRMSDSVTGQTSVDPKGYLTSMGSGGSSTNGLLGVGGAEADVADVRKAQLLLKSVVTTNPHHGPGWIAAARLEEQTKNIAGARKLIRQGCENCPTDEDVWLEAARLQTPAASRAVLADAVKHIPHSVKIWLAAAELESSDLEARKAVLRKALTLIPASEKLWMTAIALEGPDDAKIMLARAVECVPTSVDMWLALARLEVYANAQKVLNQARQAVPTEPLIWIAAAKLEEGQGHGEMVDRILQRALKSLVAQQVVVERDTWLKHAEDAERSEAPRTAAALVKLTADIGVEEADRRRTWIGDADGLAERGSLLCARAMMEKLLEAFPDSDSMWLRVADFERKHGTREALDAVLSKAVERCPRVEVLWLMLAKERWLAKDIAGARTVLKRAFAANPNSESVWLAAAKLEWENEEIERARALLAKARAQAPTDRVWQKSAQLEREVGDAAAQERLMLEGVQKYPGAPKLWMMLGQLYDGAGATDRAGGAYHTGLRTCATSIPLWTLAARLEEKIAGTARARTLLEAARLRNPKSQDLWLEAIRLERRAGNDKLAENLMAKALAECPTSGRLWSEEIRVTPRPQQKRKSEQALTQCGNDVHVVLAVARLFWQDRKYDKARKWYNRAIALNADLGDAWVAAYAFELQHGTPDTRADLEKRCAAAEPRHGEQWQAVAKRVENRRLSKVDILKQCVLTMKASEATAGSGLFEQKPAALGVVVEAAPPTAAATAAGGAATGGAAADSSSAATSAAGAASSAAVGGAGIA